MRSLVGSTGSTPISLSETIDLAPTTPSHKTMVRAAPLPSTRLQRGDEIWRVPIWQVHAFASANLEDSDVYVVMHGHGGECGGGRELGTAIINLEQIEEIARDRRDRGGDRDGGAKAAGRTSVDIIDSDGGVLGSCVARVRGVSALHRLKDAAAELVAVAAEAEDEPADAAREEEPTTWRLGVEVRSAFLHAHCAAGPRRYVLRLRVTGAPPLLSRSARPKGLTLPISLERVVYVGPRTHAYRALATAMYGLSADTSANSANSMAGAALEVSIMALGEPGGGWAEVGSAKLSARKLLTVPHGRPQELGVLGPLGEEESRAEICCRECRAETPLSISPRSRAEGSVARIGWFSGAARSHRWAW